jgi:hypothetical protein
MKQVRREIEMTSTGGPGKPKEPTYQWLCADRDCNNMDCFPSSWNTQTISQLWETNGVSSFHDGELAQATAEINAILGKIEKDNKDPKRKLSFINVRGRHLLVWAQYGAIGPDDDEKTVIKALGLKTPKAAPRKSVKAGARKTTKAKPGSRRRV